MNEEDRAALAAYKDYRAAEDMAERASSEASRAMFTHASTFMLECYTRWLDALDKARLVRDLATLKGGG